MHKKDIVDKYFELHIVQFSMVHSVYWHIAVTRLRRLTEFLTRRGNDFISQHLGGLVE